MSINEDYFKCKDLIFKTLQSNIKKNQDFLKYFEISDDIFSKSLKVEIDKFTKEIKNHKNLFNSTEVEKLIFLENSITNTEDKKFNKLLSVIKNSLSNFNLTLKIEKEKINTENINERNKSNLEYSNSEQFNYDFITNKVQNTFTVYNLNKTSKNEDLNKINEMKNKIINLHLKNEKLKQEKSEIENKLMKFCNLPSDIKKIKEMINAKKAEYLSLNN
jgi:hypothetical protein